MSAAQVILPRVWAFAAQAAPAERTPGKLAVAAEAVMQRKGPHALRLVGSAEVLERAPIAAAVAVKKVAPVPEVAFYRQRTEGMVRRYGTMKMEAGRVPSMLGRELFRSKVTSYKVKTFDDAVIFVHDVGRCVEKLSPGQQGLVERILVQGYTQEETAAKLGVCLRTVWAHYREAVDALTRMFMERRMLEVWEGGEE